MAEVTASAVKSLREKSGAGMVDCKNALVEANGDENRDGRNDKPLAEFPQVVAERHALIGLVAPPPGADGHGC